MSEPLLVTAVVVLLCAAIMSIQTRLLALQRRLDRMSRIEAKLDAMMKHSGIRFDPLDGLPGEALDALKQGRKIDAIKHYRQATGAGLAEEKDVIEEALRRSSVR